MADAILTYFDFFYNNILDFVQQSLYKSNAYLLLDKSHYQSFISNLDLNNRFHVIYMSAVVNLSLMLVSLVLNDGSIINKHR